jgi:hypothetical protein
MASKSQNYPPYSYIPLESAQHTRIVELEPALDISNPLRCRLVQVNLRDEFAYEAISYTWGSPVFSHDLFFDDKTLMNITPSLSDALRRFRLPLSTRRLWVDAVCINQSDNSEKSTQIPLMARIFGEAQRVLVWLGYWPKEERVLEELSILARKMLLSSRTGENAVSLDRVFNGLEQISKLPWFSRRWVIQEVVLNTDVSLFCGTWELSWLRLMTLVKACARFAPSETSVRALRSLSSMNDLWHRWAYDQSSEKDCSLSRLLDAFDRFECSDDRDRIYALTSLAEGLTTSTPPRDKDRRSSKSSHESDKLSEEFSIYVDYSLSTEEVYTVNAGNIVNFGHTFWLLREAADRGLSCRRQELPSWVPDWRQPKAGRSLWRSLEPPILDISKCWYYLNAPGGLNTSFTVVGSVGDVNGEDRLIPSAINWKSQPFPELWNDPRATALWMKSTFNSLLSKIPQTWNAASTGLQFDDFRERRLVELLTWAAIGGGAILDNVDSKIQDALMKASWGWVLRRTVASGSNRPSFDFLPWWELYDETPSKDRTSSLTLAV